MSLAWIKFLTFNLIKDFGAALGKEYAKLHREYLPILALQGGYRGIDVSSDLWLLGRVDLAFAPSRRRTLRLSSR